MIQHAEIPQLEVIRMNLQAPVNKVKGCSESIFTKPFPGERNEEPGIC